MMILGGEVGNHCYMLGLHGLIDLWKKQYASQISNYIYRAQTEKQELCRLRDLADENM